MTDRPILFCGPMIRALLEGRKTQTRRVMPSQDLLQQAYAPIVSGSRIYNYSGEELVSRGKFAAGNRLWVREAWKPIPKARPGGYFVPGSPFYGLDTFYRADGNCPLWANGPWKPSIHMPRWASRLTLIVTDVRVERVQEISTSDCFAEGIQRPACLTDPNVPMLGSDKTLRDNTVRGFRDLWDSLNANRGFGWEANPWVVALTFNVIKQNIDAIGEAA